MRYLPALFATILAVGCSNRCKDCESTRYHEDGRAKPIAALPMMIDTTSFDTPWSISEELTAAIAQTISKGGKIYVQSQDDFAIAANPFSGDLAWAKREFPNQEFVVFLELAEHEITANAKYATQQDVSNNLNMGIRIRVVDLRGPAPKVVLQEMVRDSYYIPKTLFPVDYNLVCWGTEEYTKSPMGIAHSQIAREIAMRISEYILLAKSR